MGADPNPPAGDDRTPNDARERELATREILEAISRSRDDEGPVFESILKNAARLCEAPLAYLRLIDEESKSLEMVAHHGTSAAFVETVRANPLLLDTKDSDTVRAVRERRVVHIEDLAAGEPYRTRQAHRVNAVETEGMRTLLLVPLLSGEACLGAISLYRREVRPFTLDQIALVETFATQAVIAIENVRQLRELQSRTNEVEQALEHQTATSEVLGVISRATNDLQPVFEAIVATAARLCRASHAVMYMRRDGAYHLAASNNAEDALIKYAAAHPHRPGRGSVVARVALDCRTVHLEDCLADREYEALGYRRVGNYRTVLGVPLLRDGEAIGVMTLLRPVVDPFSKREIALVETFAEQAVIAIENVRLFRELEARTEEVQALNATLEARVEDQVGEIERMGRLKRFLSPAVADAVVSSGSERLLSSHRALIAIVFCDIRGFTAFCETAEPEETIEVLQTYHEEMGNLISEHGAGVDHRSGDGIMVIFNDPLPCDEPALKAVEMALAMRARMARLCADWRGLGHRLGFGVGVSLGYATVGMVGSAGRYEYTASGTAVNLAARLCDHADDGEILLSPRAFRAIKDRVSMEPAGELSLKGLQAPVDVFRVVSADGPSDGG